jgi:hypothetical protein
MVLWTSAAAAQKPDFSGKWTVDPEKTQAANPAMQGGGGPPGGRGGMGMGPLTLTIDAASLTRESEGPNGAMKTVYKLDGSEQTITMGQRESKATAKWDGSTIVITSTMETQMGAMTTKAVYAMEGDWLVISTTRPGREGGETTRKVYYKKGA